MEHQISRKDFPHPFTPLSSPPLRPDVCVVTTSRISISTPTYNMYVYVYTHVKSQQLVSLGIPGVGLFEDGNSAYFYTFGPLFGQEKKR